MRRTVGALVFALTLTLTAPAAAQEIARTESELAAKGSLEGRSAAQNVGAKKWFTTGLLTGTVFGIIGAGVTVAIAAGADSDLPAKKARLMTEDSPLYRQAFTRAYTDRVNSKKRSSALTGGLIGTVISVVAIVAIASSS